MLLYVEAETICSVHGNLESIGDLNCVELNRDHCLPLSLTFP